MTSQVNDRVKVQLKVFKSLDCYPGGANDYFVAVVGSGIQLGNYNAKMAPRCNQVGRNFWCKDIWFPINSTVQYKFLVVRACTGDVTDIESIQSHTIYVGQKPIIVEHTYNEKAFDGKEVDNRNSRSSSVTGRKDNSHQSHPPCYPQSDKKSRVVLKEKSFSRQKDNKGNLRYKSKPTVKKPDDAYIFDRKEAKMSKNHNKAENLQKTAGKRMPQNARRMPQSDDIIATKTIDIDRRFQKGPVTLKEVKDTPGCSVLQENVTEPVIKDGHTVTANIKDKALHWQTESDIQGHCNGSTAVLETLHSQKCITEHLREADIIKTATSKDKNSDSPKGVDMREDCKEMTSLQNAPDNILYETDVANAPDNSMSRSDVTNAPDYILSQTEVTNTPDNILSESDATNTPDNSLSETDATNTPDNILSESDATHTPDNSLSKTDETNTSDNILSETDATNTPDNNLSETDATNTPDNILSESDATHTPDNSLSKTDATNTSDNILSETDATNTPDNSLSKTDVTNTPDNSLSESDVTNAPDNSLSKTDVTNTPDNSLSDSDVTNVPDNSLSKADATNTPDNSLSKADATNTPDNILSKADATNTPDNSLSESDVTNTHTEVIAAGTNACDTMPGHMETKSALTPTNIFLEEDAEIKDDIPNGDKSLHHSGQVFNISGKGVAVVAAGITFVSCIGYYVFFKK